MTDYRCIVVEDEELIRSNIIRKINSLNLGIAVVGEAMDGQSALKLVDELLPDIVITDIQMPIMDGLELTQGIFFNYPYIKVVIISGHRDFSYAQKAIQFQVTDYLLKPVSPEALFKTLSNLKIILDNKKGQTDSIAMEASGNLSQDEVIALIKNYILQNYDKDFTIDNISDSIHFAPPYISRIFKKATGSTPLQYLINLRINEAKQLLLSRQDLSVEAVGKLVGYFDPFYFSRIFKKHTNLYPSEFRKDHGIPPL